MSAASPEPVPVAASAAAPAPRPEPAASEPGANVLRFSKPEIGEPAPAAPSVRRLARELGIDIDQVTGSGPSGRISLNDVKAFAKRQLAGAPPPAAAPAGAAPALPDFGRWGEVEYERLSAIRRATVQNMARAWSTVPHVTQFDRADITELEALRKQYGKRVEAAGGKLTVTAIVLKVAASALKAFPKFNASLDVEGERAVLKKYVHLGVAVDTDRGLLVPVIRDADRKNIVEIAVELGDLSARARDKKITPDELQGASFTITNLGGLGTTYFSPIINWPDVAILGIGRAETLAVHREGQFVPRRILPLSLSYDHRWIDGADAARFLRWIAEALEQPLLLALEG